MKTSPPDYRDQDMDIRNSDIAIVLQCAINKLFVL